MLMRAQRRDLRIFRDVVRDDHRPDESSTVLSPHRITGTGWHARFALGLLLPDVWTAWDTDADRLWVATTDALSWAAVDRDDDRFTVHQYGPRRLWDQIEAAYLWWEEYGRPGPERFGLTVTEHSQWAWLDHPAHAARAA
ncbi:hypothetical protein ACPC54_28455 [Kitasatospora sp. NPDC094028]